MWYVSISIENSIGEHYIGGETILNQNLLNNYNQTHSLHIFGILCTYSMFHGQYFVFLILEKNCFVISEICIENLRR